VPPDRGTGWRAKTSGINPVRRRSQIQREADLSRSFLGAEVTGTLQAPDLAFVPKNGWTRSCVSTLRKAPTT